MTLVVACIHMYLTNLHVRIDTNCITAHDSSRLGMIQLLRNGAEHSPPRSTTSSAHRWRCATSGHVRAVYKPQTILHQLGKHSHAHSDPDPHLARALRPHP